MIKKEIPIWTVNYFQCSMFLEKYKDDLLLFYEMVIYILFSIQSDLDIWLI